MGVRAEVDSFQQDGLPFGSFFSHWNVFAFLARIVDGFGGFYGLWDRISRARSSVQ